MRGTDRHPKTKTEKKVIDTRGNEANIQPLLSQLIVPPRGTAGMLSGVTKLDQKIPASAEKMII